MKTIGIDLDEVLGHFLPAFIEFHNNTYGTDLKPEQFHSYYFWEILGVTKENSIQKVYDFHKTPYFKNIKPIKGSKESLEILKKNNKLFIITSRQNSIADETNRWVENNFPNIFSGIYFTNNFSEYGDVKTKAEICDNLRIDVLIEDSFLFAAECLKPNRKILLFDYPWNKHLVLPEEIERVHSWEEVMEKLIQK